MNDNEIQQFLKQHFVKVTHTLPDNSFANVNADSANPMIGYMTVNERGKGGGNSRKIRNVTFRLKDVCLALIDKGLLIAGAISLSSCMAVIGACLLALNDLNEKLKIELTEIESLIVFSLFVLSVKSGTTALGDLKERVLYDAKKGNIAIPTDIEIDKGIQNLEFIKAICFVGREVRLIEEVIVDKRSR